MKRLALMVAVPLMLFAGESDTLTVRSSSIQSNVVLVSGDVAGRKVELECFLSVADCKVPSNGDYLLLNTPTEESVYQDCRNVSLYERFGGSERGTKVGNYCLLDKQ